jgi:DHA3 family macrolide efflux protein-like MFS transporter
MTNSNSSARLSGMLAFGVVWAGQLLSVIATNMTQFALTIWIFERTGSATALGLQQVFYITPFLIISPLAGAMVDRYNRKTMMMVSDIGAGAATFVVMALQLMGLLSLWHLYLAAAVTGLCQAFQWPAYSAAISTMVSKEQYGRANGLMSLLEAGPGVLSPLLAGAALPLIGLGGIMVIDVVTFGVALIALAVVFVPPPANTVAGQQSRGNMLREATYGFRYIFSRPSLLGLQLVFLGGNLMAGIGMTLLAPMILARTGNNEKVFGLVQSVGAIGAVAGGLMMSAWGGPKRRSDGVLMGHALIGLLGQAILGLKFGLPGWLAGMVLTGLLIPVINGSNQAIWQAKVAPDVQGRVFTARRLIAWVTQPLSPLIAGPLADFVLEPAMKGHGVLPATFGWLTGTGAGSGMGLIIIGSGLVTTLIGLAAYLFPAVRNAESFLPDHDAPAPDLRNETAMSEPAG